MFKHLFHDKFSLFQLLTVSFLGLTNHELNWSSTDVPIYYLYVCMIPNETWNTAFLNRFLFLENTLYKFQTLPGAPKQHMYSDPVLGKHFLYKEVIWQPHRIGLMQEMPSWCESAVFGCPVTRGKVDKSFLLTNKF